MIIWIVILGLLFDYTNGFHDAANVVATSIATKIVRPAIAIVMATAFNFIGATQISRVAETITSGLVHAGGAPEFVVLAAVVGAIFWNFLTWYLGIPSSSSYALVGGLMGAAGALGGMEVVEWNNLTFRVIIPMVISPLAGFILALVIMTFFLRLKVKNRPFFRYLQMGSASLLALSHGLNDAQKSMAIITLGLVAAGKLSSPHIPWEVVAACAVMMAIGTATGGFRIIRTMAYEITELKPIQGFVVESTASFVILLASFWGMPLSSTHMITGSIAGVGSARGVEAVKWATARKVVWAWVLTLPGSAITSFLFIRLFY